MNNKYPTYLLLASISIPFGAQATNGYQLTGIGAYQKSLGGAVTANPGSTMTAISNPAGMARIGQRADFSLEMFMPDRFVDFTGNGGEASDSAADQYGVPALGWTAPVSDDNNDMYFGGGIYGTSGMGVDYPVTQLAAANPAVPSPAMYFEGYSAIQFWQMAPTLAWNLDRKTSFGVSLNIDYQSVALKQAFHGDTNATTGYQSDDTTMVNVDLSRTAQAFGYGLSLCVLHDLNDQITVGASYKSKQNFGDLDYQLSHGDIIGNVGFGLDPGCGTPDGLGRIICPSGTYQLELDFPQMLAVGIAYTPIKPLTISLDVKQIKWSDTLSTLNITGPNGISLQMPAGWDDQTIIALGLEYAVSDKLNLRLGFNQADAPIDDVDTDNNYILPATSTRHIAIGGDYMLNKRWQLGFHASQASEETLSSAASSPYNSKIGLEIRTVGINLGYHF